MVEEEEARIQRQGQKHHQVRAEMSVRDSYNAKLVLFFSRDKPTQYFLNTLFFWNQLFRVVYFGLNKRFTREWENVNNKIKHLPLLFLTGGGGSLNQFIEKSSVFESKRERGGEIVVVLLSQWPIGKEDYTQKQIPLSPLLLERIIHQPKAMNIWLEKKWSWKRVSKSLQWQKQQTNWTCVWS